MAAVAQRLGVSFSRGAGYYSLNKSEKVSATKDLVLERADSWIVGAAAVRAALGLGAGDVTIKPTDVARGCTLFVQSTSTNRKLASGQVAIFQKSKAAGSGSGGTAAATATW